MQYTVHSHTHCYFFCRSNVTFIGAEFSLERLWITVLSQTLISMNLMNSISWDLSLCFLMVMDIIIAYTDIHINNH